MACILNKLDISSTAALSTYNGRCKEQRSPFRSVVDFREDLLGFPSKGQCFKPFSVLQRFLVDMPVEPAPSVSADPLTVDIDVDIDVQVAAKVYREVRCRDRLPESRSRGDWGQEGENYVYAARAISLSWNSIRQIGGRSVKRSTSIRGI